jgi:hypothetical protein
MDKGIPDTLIAASAALLLVEGMIWSETNEDDSKGEDVLAS